MRQIIQDRSRRAGLQTVISRTVCILIGVLAFVPAGLQAYGTASGTVIVNSTLTNSTPVFQSSTNAGELSASYTNASGTAYNAFVKAPASRTTVTNGFDLSPVAVATPASVNTSAGSIVTFTNFVTNWGNFNENLRVRVIKGAASVPWTNAFAVRLNGVLSATNAETVTGLAPGIVVGNQLAVILRVAAFPSLADGSSNRFKLIVDDQEPTLGDFWPGAGALSPATPDVANRRDYQTNWFVVRIAGPVLDIMKSADITAGIRPFQILTYTISVTNRGSADAYKVSIRDILPSNVTNIAGSVRIWTNSALVSNTGPYTEILDGDPLQVSGQKVTFGIGTVRPGKASKLKITVRVR